ncbi:protease 2 [Bacteroidetes bacterium UKL13-3]|nr:protease 2 [Bacteroidetes bacterium UKL13-3]HCP94517.1 oligopeptidase B [Bacteroidota bacterium]
MKRQAPLFIILACATLISCQQQMKNTKPPLAATKPHTFTEHGNTRTDNYFWLKERENPEVIAYLNAENAYCDEVLKDTKSDEDALFNELKARVKENDESVPYKDGGYYYYNKYEQGKDYAINFRKKGSLDAAEELLMDENERAKVHSYYDLGSLEISNDNRMLAYSEDTVSRRLYLLHFRDLTTGKEYDEVLQNTTGEAVWASDNKTVFYVNKDTETLQERKVYRHVIGTPQSEDVLVYQEKDEEFSVSIGKTKSKKYIEIISNSTLSSEVLLLDADKPDGKFVPFLPRGEEHEYSLTHDGENFFVVTNWKAQNFRLMQTTTPFNTNKNNWIEVIAHRKDVLLEGVDVFKNFLVVEERKEGLLHIRFINRNTNQEHYLNFGEPTYTAYTSYNPEYDSDVIRYRYTSLTTPMSTYDYDMSSRKKILMKEQEVMDGGFKRENYVSERVYATAADGVKIPISLVYRKGTPKDGSAPLYQYAYGSYGSSMDAYFSTARLSLLNRGFVFAICHVRGGQEMGRQWYEDGKLLKKKNTFTDFIACSEFLINEKFTSSEKLVASGGSAGGLLMGAISNMRPDLYKVIVADVPFVDVITTMMDSSIPLTTYEYDEWGNPNEKKYYDYMLSYSPYDQVKKQAYPNMLVTSGLHDSQVQYWEPAKWVAKLRTMKTDDNVLLFKTNMEAGHGGASGRFASLKEVAFEYNFLFYVLHIKR